jgi:hypothetical protein
MIWYLRCCFQAPQGHQKSRYSCFEEESMALPPPQQITQRLQEEAWDYWEIGPGRGSHDLRRASKTVTIATKTAKAIVITMAPVMMMQMDHADEYSAFKSNLNPVAGANG